MIRESKKPKLVYRVFPLIFWKSCEVCKKEFVREWGWRSTIGGEGWLFYICQRCASIRKVAQKLFEELPRNLGLNIIREGMIKKGGQNRFPKTPRPAVKPVGLGHDRNQRKKK